MSDTLQAGSKPASLQQFAYRTLVLMTIVIPLWVGVGRGLFGSLGIGAFYTAALAAPLLFVMQLVITLIVRQRPVLASPHALSPRLTGALVTYYLAAAVFGFTFEDFTANGSALLSLTGDFPVGDGYMSGISWWVSVVSALIAALSLLLSLAWAIRDQRARS